MGASAPRTEIFLVGYYGFRNTGDEAILSSILSELRQACSDASFTVISHDPSETAARYGVRAIPWFEPHAIAEATDKAHLVVVGGGGLFHDTSGFSPDSLFTKQNWGLGLYSGAAMYGSLSGKRVMLYGVGIGPLRSELATEYTKAACLAADVVTVRDELSREVLESAGVPRSRVILTADCAFASQPCPKNTDILRDLFPKPFSSGPTVGVVVREWSVDVRPDHWEGQLAHALDGFVQSEGGRLIFIPFQTLESEKENDLAVARRVASQLNPQADVAVVDKYITSEELKALIAACGLVVGMRLHSVVFAAQAGVPVVALSYDPKVSTLVQRLRMTRFDLPLRNLQGGRLRELMTQAVEQKSAISASLRAASEELASEAERNGELARELIQRPVKPKSLPTELLPIVARAIKGQIAAAKQMDERMQSQQAQVDQLSTVVTRQHTDNKELTEQVKQQGEKVEELSACVRKQHADNEELIGQLEQRREQVDELTACVAKQHADNEQMIGQLKQLQERIEELSTDARQQRADKGELISCVAEKEGEVAKLREQLRGKDRFVLEDDQRHALKERELEKRIHLNYAQIRRSHRRWSCGDSGTRVNSVISQVVFSAVSLPV